MCSSLHQKMRVFAFEQALDIRKCGTIHSNYVTYSRWRFNRPLCVKAKPSTELTLLFVRAERKFRERKFLTSVSFR